MAEEESRIAEKSRDGFHGGVVRGMVGMALAGLTGGKYSLRGEPLPIAWADDFYSGKLPRDETRDIIAECRAKGVPSHDALMDACGWPRFRSTVSCW
ncbi:MAG: hypothetical protein WDO73_31595 [Ignavibacteriota bacterium]